MSGLAIAIGAAGYGAYEGVKYLSGNFGQDEADAALRGADVQGGREEQSMAANLAGTQGAQAGLQPYQQGGTNALQMQQALSGAMGPDAQAQAYQALQNSPMFAQLLESGNTNILQNASATGGLRGGNTQQALAQFGPQLLQQLAQQQFGQLGQLSGMGLQAAGQSGQFGVQGAGAQAAGFQNLGAIEAGGILGQQQAMSNFKQNVTNTGLQAAGGALTLATGLPIPTPQTGGGF